MFTGSLGSVGVLRWLILLVSLSGPRSQDIWLNIILDVSMRVLWGENYL